MWIYVSAAVPSVDNTVKMGMVPCGRCYDRLANYNCSSARPWRGVFLKVHTDAEQWEQALLDIFSDFRIPRHYGDSEVIYGRAALNCVQGIVAHEYDTARLALAFWAVCAVGELLEFPVAMVAMEHTIRGALEDYEYQEFRSHYFDLRTRTTRWVPASNFDPVDLTREFADDNGRVFVEKAYGY